jgi:hypothetical protein
VIITSHTLHLLIHHIIQQHFTLLISTYQNLRIPYVTLVQDVWIIRSLWHGISDAGMMEFSNINNSKTIPSGIGKFPAGKNKGSLEGQYSAIRMCHEMTSLLVLDLLQGGGKS